MVKWKTLTNKNKTYVTLGVILFVSVLVYSVITFNNGITTDSKEKRASTSNKEKVETLSLDGENYTLVEGLNYVTKVAPKESVNKRIFVVKVVNSSLDKNNLTFPKGVAFEYWLKDLSGNVKDTGVYHLSKEKETVQFDSGKMHSFEVDLTDKINKLADGTYMLELSTKAKEVENAVYGLSVTKNTQADTASIVSSEVEFVKLNKDSSVQLKKDGKEERWSYNTSLEGFFKRQEKGTKLIIGHTQGETLQVVTARIQ